MIKGLAIHSMTMTFTTHLELCRNLSIGFLAKLPPCHSKGKNLMLQSGSMKKLLAEITGLKSGLGSGKLHEVDSLTTYSKKSKVCFFLTWKTCFKKKGLLHLPIDLLEKILWGTNTSACARKPYCVFPFKLRVLKTSVSLVNWAEYLAMARNQKGAPISRKHVMDGTIHEYSLIRNDKHSTVRQTIFGMLEIV